MGLLILITFYFENNLTDIESPPYYIQVIQFINLSLFSFFGCKLFVNPFWKAV